MSEIPDVKESNPGIRKSMTGMPEKKPNVMQLKDSIATSNQSIQNDKSQVTIKKEEDSQNTSAVARQYVNEVVERTKPELV